MSAREEELSDTGGLGNLDNQERDRSETDRRSFILTAFQAASAAAAFLTLGSRSHGQVQEPPPFCTPPYQQYKGIGDNCHLFFCPNSFACQGSLLDDFECTFQFECTTLFNCVGSYDGEDCEYIFNCFYNYLQP